MGLVRAKKISVNLHNLCFVYNYTGGSVTIAFDRDALTVAGSADYEFTSVDNIAIKILQLFYEIQCTVFVDVTTTYNVEMSLVSENTTYTYECVTLAKVKLHLLVWYSLVRTCNLRNYNLISFICHVLNIRCKTILLRFYMFKRMSLRALIKCLKCVPFFSELTL